jgi:hypothetical protein
MMQGMQEYNTQLKEDHKKPETIILQMETKRDTEFLPEMVGNM